jgi:hypothetical protein
MHRPRLPGKCAEGGTGALILVGVLSVADVTGKVTDA